MIASGEAEPGTVPPVGPGPGGVVLVCWSGAGAPPDRSAFGDDRDAVRTYDLASGGLGGVVQEALACDARVVHLPALLGRWLPPLDAGAVPTAERTVVLDGATLDPRSVAGVREAFGPDTHVVAAPGAGGGPALWEVEARLRALAGVADAVAAPARDGGPVRAWIALEAGAAVDPVAVEAAVGAPPAFVGLVTGSLADVPGSIWSTPGPGPGTRPRELGCPRLARDDVERDLLAALAQFTEFTPLGIDDRLVDVGCTEECSAWLADDVRSRFGVPIRAAELIELPTVGDLAEVIRRDRGRSVRRPVTVTLAAGSPTVPTLFLVHDLDGSPFGQIDLAAHLGRRVVGFESPLLAGTPSPFERLELMALRYLADVRRIQPDGPYHLAGWGFGGALAFEMARQLLAEDATVERLTVADTGPAALVPGRAPQRRRRIAVPARPAPADQRVGVPERRDHARAAHQALLDAYRWPVGRRYDLDVTLAWSPHVGSLDATMGWASLVGSDHVAVRRLEPPAGDAADPAASPGWAAVLAATRPAAED